MTRQWHNPFTPNAATPDPVELVPDVCYGDGKPLDVGHDRAIANALNVYSDWKSAHQPVMMLAGTDASVPGLIGFTISDAVSSMYIYPIFCGLGHVGVTVSRSLTVAPWFKSNTGATAYVRVTLARELPSLRPAEAEGAASGGAYGDPIYQSGYSQTSTWTTNSTTWQTGSDATLDLSVCDPFFGVGWLIVEGSGDVFCRGLAKCVESARVVG